MDFAHVEEFIYAFVPSVCSILTVGGIERSVAHISDHEDDAGCEDIWTGLS